VNRELAGLTLMKETFKKEWEGAVRTLRAAVHHGIQVVVL
jgi:hypothetical protein